MRDSIIYFRNNPSILFWEAGNTVVTPADAADGRLRKQWDPDGGRVMGAAATTTSRPIPPRHPSPSTTAS
jgi:beta-galactosidase